MSRFKAAVVRVHDRSLIPTPQRVLRELGRSGESRSVGGPLLNGRETKWRREVFDDLGYVKQPNGRYARPEEGA